MVEVKVARRDKLWVMSVLVIVFLFSVLAGYQFAQIARLEDELSDTKSELRVYKFLYTRIIALESWRWHSNQVMIYVNEETIPACYRDALQSAIGLWNNAIEWFNEEYDLPINLVLNTTDFWGASSVQFTIGNESVPNAGFVERYQFDRGAANIQDSELGFINIRIVINTNVFQLACEAFKLSSFFQYYLEYVIAHELGHVLGLGHTGEQGDLMTDRSLPLEVAVSTLDLYGLYVAYQEGNQDASFAILPQDIFYVTYP